MMWIFLLVVSSAFIALGLLAPFFVFRCANAVGAGAKWVVGIFVLETLLVILPPLPLGINVYPQDLVFLLIGTCAVGRFFWFSERDPWSTAWMLLGAVWLGSFVIGVMKFKTVAGVEFRPFFYFWAATAYFAGFRYTKELEQVVWNALKWGAFALLLIACYRWMADAVGFSSINWGVLVGASPFRVLNSAHSHFLASVLMVLLVRYGNWNTSRMENYLTLFLVLAVLLLQHRTVWVLVFMALAVIVFREPATRRRLVLPVALGGIGIVLVIIAGIASGLLDSIFAALQRSVEEAFKGEGSTLSWRVQSWQELLKIWARDGPLVNLFGYPFGNGWERYVADLKHSTNYSPHSFYVQLLLRGGIVAFTLVCGIYLTLLLRINKNDVRSELYTSSVLVALALGQLAYFATYGPGYMQGVFLGVTFSLLRAMLSEASNKHGASGSGMQKTYNKECQV